jgi:hypothetical protein
MNKEFIIGVLLMFVWSCIMVYSVIMQFELPV